MKGWYNIHKSINVIHHINKMMNKKHDNINRGRKTFYNIQCPFIIKILSIVGIEGTYLNIIKAIYDKPTASIIVNGKN